MSTSTRPVYGQTWEPSQADPGAMYRQSIYTKRGKDNRSAKDGGPGYPLWQRVEFLAMGRRRRNGHATFAKGELQQLLCADRDQVTKAIKRAVALGCLDAESNTTNHRCLIVPLDHVCLGFGGQPWSDCAYCGPVKH